MGKPSKRKKTYRLRAQFRNQTAQDVVARTVEADHLWFSLHPGAVEMIRKFVPGEATYNQYKPTHMVVLRVKDGAYHRFQYAFSEDDECFVEGRMDITSMRMFSGNKCIQSLLAQDILQYEMLVTQGVQPYMYLSPCSEIVGFSDTSYSGKPQSKGDAKFIESIKMR